VSVKREGIDPAGTWLAVNYTNPTTGEEFTVVYQHLSNIFVKKGEQVKQGELLAKSGNTGFTLGKTGCHLHFHMWSGKGKKTSHTMPIERLVMKQVGVDSNFREYNASKGELDDDKIAGKLFESNNVPLFLPILTSPLEITPVNDTYYTGDTLTAKFNITNKGSAPITFDVLTVGGRLNGWCPIEGCPDFTHRSLTLHPDETYHYEGSLTLTQPGNYHFFIAYHTKEHMPGEDENNWNTNIDVEVNGAIIDGFTAANYREKDVTVRGKTYIESAQGPATWEKISGPWEGELKELSQIAVEPGNPEVIYAVVHYYEHNPFSLVRAYDIGDELYKSVNGGESWQAINNGLPHLRVGHHYQPIGAIAIAPSNPDIIYVGTADFNPHSSTFPTAKGIYKSTKGGSSGWTAVGGPSYTTLWVIKNYYSISSMVVDPANADIVYVGTIGGGVWKTENGSWKQIWRPTGELVYDINALAISPANPNIIYAAAYNYEPYSTVVPPVNTGLVYHGGLWKLEKIEDGSYKPSKILDRRVDDIVIDSSDPNKLFVITNGYEVKKSTNGGSTWVEASGTGEDALPDPIDSPFNSPQYSLVMEPHPTNDLRYILFVATDVDSLKGDAGGIRFSPDSGENWFPIGPSQELENGKKQPDLVESLTLISDFGYHILYAIANVPQYHVMPSFSNSNHLFKLDFSNSAIVVQKYSPVELHINDSHGNVTGLIDGNAKAEIPKSLYYNGTVTIFNPNDTYHYELIGTDNGTYGLSITSVENGTSQTFARTNVSISTNATHQYTINWSDHEATVRIDADGDGTFEQNVTLKQPVASFVYSPENPVVNQTITFNASSSYDPDGNITSYEWDFGDGNVTSTTYEILNHSYSEAGSYDVTLTVTDNDGVTNSTTKEITVYPPTAIFDTGAPTNPYPSIAGTHNGTIKPNQTITVSTLYTYPCAGTGGHTEYARIWNSTLDVNATWNGYADDWHNISFNEPFTLVKDEVYNYTIRTGSYPQIIHARSKPVTGGLINCTKFIDANGKVYYDWIPAIKLS